MCFSFNQQVCDKAQTCNIAEEKSLVRISLRDTYAKYASVGKANMTCKNVIKQFQIIQKDYDYFLVNLILDEDIIDNEGIRENIVEDSILASIKDERLYDTEFDFEYYDDLFPDVLNGKLKYFIKEIKMERDERYEKTCNMLLNLILIAIVLIGCGNVNKSSSNNKISESKNYISVRGTVDVDEEKELGGYKFKLNKVVYDDNTKSGYIQIEISSEEKDISKLKWANGFYDKLMDDESTYIVLDGCYNNRFRYEYSDKEINLYGFFVDQENVLDGKFNFTNSETGEKIEFELPDCKVSENYLYEDMEIWISPMNIYLKNGYLDDISSLVFIMKNGEKIDVMKDRNVYDTAIGSCSGNGKIYNSYIWLNGYIDDSSDDELEKNKLEKIDYKEIDNENIDYIEINNQKIERS